MKTSSQLQFQVEADRGSVGQAAARAILAALQSRLALQSSVRMVFAAAPSQREMLTELASASGVDWSRVTAFHMDEYLGLAPDAPERFGNWLRSTLFDRVPLGQVHLIEPGLDPWRTAHQYATALAAAPIDRVCLGIGDNGHLAFNDPPVADLNDPADVKVVELDEACRRQQVDDDCFPSLADVPRRAITLTTPRLLASSEMFCIAPGSRKQESVRRALTDPIGAACPATALRTHPHCTLFLDQESAAGVPT